MERLTANLARSVRYAQLGGRDHIVAPVTLIVPGVLSGSKGPLLYPADEIAKDPSVWNHMPLVVYHPNVAGQHVTARDPEILNRQGVGVLLNAHISKGRLVAEGWFDVENTRRVDDRVLAALMSRKPIELSTGLFTDNEVAPQGATYNGRPYDYIARNYRPDHLAILPDQIGACSIKDGCGVLVNAQDDPTVVWNRLAKQLKLNEEWITISGTHVLVKDGQQKGEAVKAFIEKKDGSVGKLGKRDKANKVGDRGIALSRRADKAKVGQAAAKAHAEASKQHSKAFAAYARAGDKVAADYHFQLAKQHAHEATKHTGLHMASIQEKRVGLKEKKAGLALPKNQTKVSIKQAGYHLAKQGYKLGSGSYSISEGKTSYKLIHEKTGKETTVTSDEIKKMLYKPTHNQRVIMPQEKTRQSIWNLMGSMLGILNTDQQEEIEEEFEDGLLEPTGNKIEEELEDQDGQAGSSSVSDTSVVSNKGEPDMAKMSEGDRKTIVDGLIANVCCWKEEDRVVLNTLTDTSLVRLRDEAVKVKQQEAVVNAAREGFGFGNELTVNEMPAALKAALDKKNGKKPAKSEEDMDEEEEEVVPAKNKKAACNQQTEEEWLKAAPQSVQNSLHYARQIEERERQTIIGKLISNVAADKKQAVLNRLSSKPLDELNDLLALAAPVAQSRPNYLGAASPATNSADLDDNDVLLMPTLDFSKKE